MRRPSSCWASCGLGHWPRGAQRLAPARALASDGRRFGAFVNRSTPSNGDSIRVTSAYVKDCKAILAGISPGFARRAVSFNKRLLQTAQVHRFRFDAGSSPALFPLGGSGPIVSPLKLMRLQKRKVLGGQERTPRTGKEQMMTEEEESCGAELAASAAIPEEFGRLFSHVAANLRVHAAWVGTGTDAASRERAAMLSVAESYDFMSSAAVKTATLMRSLSDLPPAPHDPSGLDREAFAQWMAVKIQLQRSLARTLLEHAEQSQRVLDELVG